jgi:hypothetical protein
VQWLTSVILAIREDHSSKPGWANSSQDHISTNNWTQWHMPVIPGTWGNTNRRIEVRFYLKNNQSKKGL